MVDQNDNGSCIFIYGFLFSASALELDFISRATIHAFFLRCRNWNAFSGKELQLERKALEPDKKWSYLLIEKKPVNPDHY